MAADSRANRANVDHIERRNPHQLASLLGRWDDGPGSLYDRLASAIASLIDNGVLRPGEALPPERRLADALSVARGTVVSCYGVLAERGLVERMQGSGTRVAGTVGVRTTGHLAKTDGLFALHGSAIDLRVAMPPMLERTAAAIDRVQLGRDPALLADAEPAGLLPLRERIAEHMTRSGLPTTPWQIMVTSGAQQAIVVALSGVITPGDVVLAEAVTWPGLVDAIVQRGGRVHGVAMDDDGMIPDAMEAAIQRLRPVAVGINPHHHNPTGSRMSPRRRRDIAELAAAYRVPIIEDRALSSLAFDGQVPAPLASHTPGHLVVDSINKVAWPGLRLGWLRADPDLITQLRPVRATIDLYSPLHSQLAAIEVLDDWDQIVADRCAELRDGVEVALDAIARRLPEWEVARPRGGLVLWPRLPGGGAAAFTEHAARHGVLVASSKEFSVEHPFDDEHVRVPFTLPGAVVEEGIERLAAAWASFEPERRQPYAPTSVM